MAKSPHRFAQLLTQAVRRITVNTDSKIQIVQDELGYALGRDAGGSSIEYWRKGHVPAQLPEIEQLARQLVQQGGLTSAGELEQFLAFADHPQPTVLTSKLFSPAQPATPSLPKQTIPPLPGDQPTFIAGPPIVHPKNFFGRGKELKRLFNLVKRRPLQNAAIIGPRRSGKTSLLNYLKHITTVPDGQLRPQQRNNWLTAAQQYRWILVDFQDARLGTREGLLNHLLNSLSLPIEKPCTLDYFLNVVSQRLQTPTVILLDEIGVALQRYPELDDAFWEGLRALATNQVEGNLAFVLAAHQSPAELAQHSDFGSPFFNIFGYTAHLGPLKPAEATELINSSPLPFSADDTTWILEQSQGWPILLQILCRERLLTLEEAEPGPEWQADGLQQIKPFIDILG